MTSLLQLGLVVVVCCWVPKLIKVADTKCNSTDGFLAAWESDQRPRHTSQMRTHWAWAVHNLQIYLDHIHSHLQAGSNGSWSLVPNLPQRPKQGRSSTSAYLTLRQDLARFYYWELTKTSHKQLASARKYGETKLRHEISARLSLPSIIWSEDGSLKHSAYRPTRSMELREMDATWMRYASAGMMQPSLEFFC